MCVVCRLIQIISSVLLPFCAPSHSALGAYTLKMEGARMQNRHSQELPTKGHPPWSKNGSEMKSYLLNHRYCAVCCRRSLVPAIHVYSPGWVFYVKTRLVEEPESGVKGPGRKQRTRLEERLLQREAPSTPASSAGPAHGTEAESLSNERGF